MAHPARSVDGVLRRIAADLATALLPGRCPGCGARGEPVCEACRASLRPAPPARPPQGIDAWAAPFAYDGVARELVARVKYRSERRTVPWLADAMAGAVAGVPLAVRPDLVTWAPTTAERRRERGFDHAELLARAVADRLGLPAARLLVREPGAHQTGRPSAERRVGPRFTAGSGAAERAALVVDDVATTGATLAAAAHALRGSGAFRVIAVVAARTPARRSGGSEHAAYTRSDVP